LSKTPKEREQLSPGDDFDSLYRNAMEFHRRGDDAHAITLLGRSLELQPMHFEATYNLGACLFQLGQPEPARNRFERALLIKPGNREALFSLATVLMDMNQLDAAKRFLQQLTDIDPGHIDAHLALATIQQTLGSPEDASRCYRQALEYHPQSARLWHAWAMQRDWQPGDPEMARMLAASSTESLGDEDRTLFAYALGKMHDDLKDYEQAMISYRVANELQTQQQSYDYGWQSDFFSRHKRWQAAKTLRPLNLAAVADATPVFVMGMPRSGTSLVEQILASHSQVSGAGEVEFTRILADACESQTGQLFPEKIDEVEPAVMTAAALDYIERLRCAVDLSSDSTHRVVDKLPHNFLRAGLLATLMPQASFVLCERDPMDVCLSIYRQRFSSNHSYACDLGNLGSYYRLYQELVSYWEEQFPGKLYRLSYENLVSDPEYQLRGLLTHLGLPFDHACLAYHENNRLVTTPSAAQVRRPLYTGAVGHWRQYSAWLEPLQDGLRGVPT
jgi:tetratricopeptide (TPR) repeat protein